MATIYEKIGRSENVDDRLGVAESGCAAYDISNELLRKLATDPQKAVRDALSTNVIAQRRLSAMKRDQK